MIQKEDIEKLIASCTKELEAIGYKVKPVHFKRFYPARSRFAQVWYASGDLDFSEYFRDAPIDQIEATIMHECCHMVEGAGRGHGKEWKAIAAAVSKAYPTKYNIKRCGNNTAKGGPEWDLNIGKPKPTIVDVKCPGCGMVYRMYSNSRRLKHLNMYYCTKCHTYLA